MPAQSAVGECAAGAGEEAITAETISSELYA